MGDDLTKEISECDTSIEIWMMLEVYFASHSRVKIFRYKSELRNIKNGNTSINAYVIKIKEIVMQLFAYWYIVSEGDHVQSLLNVIDKDCDLVHVVISSKIDLVIVREVHSMLLIHEKRLKKHNSNNIDNLLSFTNLISNHSKKFFNETSGEIIKWE